MIKVCGDIAIHNEFSFVKYLGLKRKTGFCAIESVKTTSVEKENTVIQKNYSRRANKANIKTPYVNSYKCMLSSLESYVVVKVFKFTDRFNIKFDPTLSKAWWISYSLFVALFLCCTLVGLATQNKTCPLWVLACLLWLGHGIHENIQNYIWVRPRKCGCLVTWFCYQLIAKPGNKTAAVPWPRPYAGICADSHTTAYDNKQMKRCRYCPSHEYKLCLIIPLESTVLNSCCMSWSWRICIEITCMAFQIGYSAMRVLYFF